MQSNFDYFFYKSELPEVRMKFALRVILTYKNSTNNKNTSAKEITNILSSMSRYSKKHVLVLSGIELSRFLFVK